MRVVALSILSALVSSRAAEALPPGRAWTPVDTLNVGGSWIGWPHLRLMEGDRLRMTGTAVTVPQSVVLHEWMGDHWELDSRIEYQAGYVIPFLSEADEEHLVWKGIETRDIAGNYTYILATQTLPVPQAAPDTLASTWWSSLDYAGAASSLYRWVVVEDFGNTRLFSQRRPAGAWTEIAFAPNGNDSLTIAALDDTSALVAWANLSGTDSGLGSALVRGSNVVEVPIPQTSDTGLRHLPRLRPHPGGGFWMAYGAKRPYIRMTRFDGQQWSLPESLHCAYHDADYYYAESPDVSQDIDNTRPVVAWSAYSSTTGRDVLCVSCPTETGWGLGEELPQNSDGLLPSPARDELGDVWIAWWKFGGGAFWIHSYTTAEIKDALVDGAPDRRRVAWQITAPAPKSWWSILRAENDSAYSVVGRVQAGGTHAVEWTDSTAQNVLYRYRIRRDCKDTRYELLSEPIVSDPALIGVDPIGIAWLPIRLTSEVGNPVRGALRLRVEGAAPGAVAVELFDVRGRSLGTRSGTAGSTGIVSFDLGLLGSGNGTMRPAGLYFARAHDERGRPSRVLKLIVL